MYTSNLKIPADITNDLSKFIHQAETNLGKELTSIYLFGGISKDEYIPNYSDINILLILKKASLETLEKLGAPLTLPMYQLALSPFVLEEDELKHAANLFPIKFLDITRNHILLHGEDILSNITIDDELLKRNCRRELKNLLFRLNLLALKNYGNEEFLGTKIKQLFSSFVLQLSILCYLKTNHYHTKKTTVLLEASNALGLDKDFLLILLEIKNGKINAIPQSPKQLYDQFMQLVKHVSSIADTL